MSAHNVKDKDSDDRSFKKQTDILLGTNIKKENNKIVVLYEPELRVTQVYKKKDDDDLTIELEVVASSPKKIIF